MERRSFLVGAVSIIGLLAVGDDSYADEKLRAEEMTIAELVSSKGGISADASDETFLALEAIERIPYSVINKGEQAVGEWIKNYVNIRYTPASQGSFISGRGDYSPAGINWPACIGAAGLALVNNAIPITKITKLKAFFKGIGGVKVFIDAYSRSYQQLRRYGYRGADLAKRAAVAAAHHAGPDVKDALLSFFGIAAVLGACTEW
ncbi:hypothetical protein [Rothia nasimurium]|uniref:hypothetical protein n=1 Tax=Rothia nasimurium TaxID=85336 RepID=UPI001D169B90|nr:hypothetical protein [Rothia nasimurium]